MPWHPLSTGLFWSTFPWQLAGRKYFCKLWMRTRPFKYKTNHLGINSPPLPYILYSLLAPGRGDINGRKSLVPSMQFCFTSLLPLPWCPLAVLALWAGSQHGQWTQQSRTQGSGSNSPAHGAASINDCPCSPCHCLREGLGHIPLPHCTCDSAWDKISWALPHLLGKARFLLKTLINAN